MRWLRTLLRAAFMVTSVIVPAPERRETEAVPLVGASESQMQRERAQEAFRASTERQQLVSSWRRRVAESLAARPTPQRDLATYRERSGDEWQPAPTAKPTSAEWGEAGF